MRCFSMLLSASTSMLLLFGLSNARTEDVSIKFIVAGIRHYDLKIKTVQFEGILDYVVYENDTRYRSDYVLAYEGEKSFLDLHHQRIAKPRNEKLVFEDYALEYIYDGERTWWIFKDFFFSHYSIIDGRNFEADFDPRFYIARSRNGYASHTLDEYLLENGAEVAGEETIEVKQGAKVVKEPSYLIYFERKGTKEIEKFWLSKRSFRLVKYQFERESADSTHKFEFTILYNQFQDGIWYPISIVWDSSDYFPDGSKTPTNVGTVTLSNVKINSDVSALFRFNVPPFVDIYDFNADKLHRASDLLGRTDNEPSIAEPILKRKETGIDEMVLIPAGEFRMGSDLDNEDEKRINAVYLDSYYVDRYEVTNQEYTAFLNAVGRIHDADGYVIIDLESPYCRIKQVDGKYQVQQGFEHHPVLTVSWFGAEAYARWRGKRLPTEAEWEKAARGRIEGKEYPWGNTASHAHANYEGTEDIDIWLFTAPVGSFVPNGYGLYDMSGNAGEWCADWYGNHAHTPDRFRTPEKSELKPSRVVRGGNWATDAPFLRCAFRTSSAPGLTHETIGFRCAKNVSTEREN